MPRTAVPTVIKELAGNPGKRPLNKKEPKPTGGPVPPKVMTKHARAVWKRLVAGMPLNVFTGCDSALLAAYCEAVSVHATMTALIAAEDFEPFGTGSTGQSVVNPAYKTQADQARLIATLGQRLGLDPIARQAINAPAPTVSTNPFDDLVR